jgi:phosphoribosylformylglycinamidine synthase
MFEGADVEVIRDQSLNISSTQLKIYSYLGQDIEGFTPVRVAQHIKDQKLYVRQETLNVQRKEPDMSLITPEMIASHGLTMEEYDRVKQLLSHEPNLTELGMFSVLWSEHCSYKNSKPLLKRYPTTGPFVLQGPGENAGIVDIGDGVAISFKIESHNHPSAIEPYQGAATGAGGIIRDIFAMGARPIASLDSLRFGHIEHSKHNRHLFENVVKGIGDYGNCVGIPTVAGDVYFEGTYNDNCLVNAMCVGVVQSGDKPIGPLYGPIVKGIAAGVGNPIIYAGSSTGRDGIHGATFASVELSDESADRKSSVQVGDPFQEKLLIEACLELLKTGVVVGLGDMGAAGLSSSLSEMASRGQHGVEIDVALVPQREKNMTPYEIMLSESQERMVVVVQKGKEEEAFKILRKWDIYAVTIGHVTDDGQFRVLEGGQVVADIPALALTDHAPIYSRPSRQPEYIQSTQQLDFTTTQDVKPEEAESVLRTLLATPNIASKRWVYEQYDHMVQLNTVVLPGRADAAVLKIQDTQKRIAVKTDGNGRFCYLDPETGGKIAVSEAARNVACTGARPIAMTNCLNFGNPEKPESFWQLEKAVNGMSEACKVLGTPVISGNVSLYNESEQGAIYPTPVVGILGLFEHDLPPMTMSFKKAGDKIYLIGDTYNEIGGTEYLKKIHHKIQGLPPRLLLQTEKTLQDSLISLIQNEQVQSVHDLSDGGLLVAIVECLDENKLGADIDLSKDRKLRLDALLFGETQSRVIVSVSSDKAMAFEAAVAHLPVKLIGQVVDQHRLSVKVEGSQVMSVSADTLIDLYDNAIGKIMGHL